MLTDAAPVVIGENGECLEIEGRYFSIGPRLQSLVRCLQRGCTEADVKHEVELLWRDRRGDIPDLSTLLDEIFAPFGLVIARAESIWRLRAATSDLGSLSMESAIRCRVTILPEGVASRTATAVKGLYTQTGAAIAGVLWLLAVGLYLGRFGVRGFSLDLLFASLHQMSAETVVISVFTIVGSYLFHEIGHCAAVAAFGARVRRIGFGIYWLSPAFFSDVSSAWTLSRWQRVAVDCGGIYFQLLTCGGYALLAVTINDHSVQMALQISIMVNLVSVLCSLDPLMKYDGYWMISDALDIPNLRRRSEVAMREWVRSAYLGNEVETGGTSRHRGFLIGYGVFSIVFTVLLLLVLTIAIRSHVGEAIAFPGRVWSVAKQDIELRHFGPEVAQLGLAMLRLIPVACAPIALMTAISSILGFVRRVSAKG